MYFMEHKEKEIKPVVPSSFKKRVKMFGLSDTDYDRRKKLSSVDDITIKALYSAGHNYSEIGKKYGVSGETIKRHIYPEEAKKHREYNKAWNEANPDKVLAMRRTKEEKRAYKQGHYEYICKLVGLTVSEIQNPEKLSIDRKLEIEKQLSEFENRTSENFNKLKQQLGIYEKS